MHAFPTGELYFDDCRVPKENMLTASSYLNLIKWFNTHLIKHKKYLLTGFITFYDNFLQKNIDSVKT